MGDDIVLLEDAISDEVVDTMEARYWKKNTIPLTEHTNAWRTVLAEKFAKLARENRIAMISFN